MSNQLGKCGSEIDYLCFYVAIKQENVCIESAVKLSIGVENLSEQQLVFLVFRSIFHIVT